MSLNVVDSSLPFAKAFSYLELGQSTYKCWFIGCKYDLCTSFLTNMTSHCWTYVFPWSFTQYICVFSFVTVIIALSKQLCLSWLMFAYSFNGTFVPCYFNGALISYSLIIWWDVYPRWHNHLNPSINKEAWTQEEEIALIHAHQIYGNKWAELTKFLPGRWESKCHFCLIW